MKEHPILFSGEMVRAILEGRKTQTRRVITPQPDEDGLDREILNYDPRVLGPWVDTSGNIYKCPSGVPGDRLWVRETWRITGGFADTPIRELNPAYKNNLQFRADRDESYIDKYHPSIFMPRWASRITLDVVNVRVERVQDISEEDARAEGIDDGWLVREQFPEARIAYRYLWDSINAKRGYGWATNPWVWVIEFK